MTNGIIILNSICYLFIFFLYNKGFVPRLQKEIIKIIGSRHDLEIKADSLRHYSAWIGGSMLGSLSTFQNLAITRGEYDENPEGKLSIVQKRTF